MTPTRVIEKKPNGNIIVTYGTTTPAALRALPIHGHKRYSRDDQACDRIAIRRQDIAMT
jgi:hypothetical protein